MDKRTRYEQSVKGKEARSRSQANRKAKRNALRRELAAPVYRTSEEIAQSAREGVELLKRHAEEKERKRQEFYNNPPEQDRSTDVHRDARADRLLELFVTRTGKVGREQRQVIWHLLRSNPMIFDSIIEKLAKDYTAGKPPADWLKRECPEEEIRGEVFHEGRTAFIAKFGREFARYLISERRMERRRREKALVDTLCGSLLVHLNG
jgi:hypothetical protein